MQSVTLRLAEEPVALDLDRLAALCRTLGAQRAPARLSLALEALAVALAEVEAGWRLEDRARVAAATETASSLAESLGMMRLAATVSAVRGCLDAGDAVAMAATLARMLRLGERSLAAVWERHGLSL